MTNKDKQDFATIKSQKTDMKKSPSIKVWSNLDSENKYQFNTIISRSLDPKHKSSKSEAIEHLNKKLPNSNSGSINPNKLGLSKKGNSKMQSSDINSKILFQVPFQTDSIPETKFIPIDQHSDIIFQTANSSKSKEKKTPSTKRHTTLHVNSLVSSKHENDAGHLLSNSVKIPDGMMLKN